jgi:hypothetical protein
MVAGVGEAINGKDSGKKAAAAAWVGGALGGTQ